MTCGCPKNSFCKFCGARLGYGWFVCHECEVLRKEQCGDNPTNNCWQQNHSECKGKGRKCTCKCHPYMRHNVFISIGWNTRRNRNDK